MSGLPEEMNLIQIGDPMALKLFVRSSSVFFLHLCSPPSAPPLFLRRFTPASKLLEIPTHATTRPWFTHSFLTHTPTFPPNTVSPFSARLYVY